MPPTGEVAATTSDFTVGRGDVRLPAVEWRERSNAESQFFSFFRRLLQTNGYDMRTEEYDRALSRNVPRPFHHDLVVPANTEKPLTLIQGSFSPHSYEQVEAALAYSKSRQEWGQWDPIVSAVETYGLYMPPQVAGSWEPLLEVTLVHQKGGTGGGVVHSPYSIMRIGEAVEESAATGPQTDESWEQQRAEHSERLRVFLVETVQFLQS